MNRQTAARRRVKKRKAPVQNSRVKFSVFLGIMVLAVLLGYLTARFVVGPLIGYDADESPARIAGQEEESKEKDAEKDEENNGGGERNTESDAERSEGNGSGSGLEAASGTIPTDGYALQFGVFSTREAAESMAKSLKDQGIETEIAVLDDMYKVISPLFDSREEALTSLEALAEKNVEDVFITSFG